MRQLPEWMDTHVLRAPSVREELKAFADMSNLEQVRTFTLPGSQQRLPRARELELRRPRHALRGYPYAFCNCLPQRICI
jgi:hypothetical protein